MPLRAFRSVLAWTARAVVALVALVLVVVLLGIVVAETSWAKERLRRLAVSQASRYLTAQLEIGHLGGSLLRGVQLDDVRVVRDGRVLISIASVRVEYSLRELVSRGVVVRRLQVVRPVVRASRQADGRWDLATLVRHDAREQSRSGPARPLTLEAIEVVDGDVRLDSPVSFGAAHIPTVYERLNISCAFEYRPVHWRLTFSRAAWAGSKPALSVTALSGSLENGSDGFVFRRFSIESLNTSVTIDGRIHHERTPTALDLHADAGRFAFQEWGGVIRGLTNIAVTSSFAVDLHGPLSRLATDIRLQSDGGSVTGRVSLNTTVPGWSGTGRVEVESLDLARWLNRPDRGSNIAGRVVFTLALGLGEHFPTGSYAFTGPHAEYMTWAADSVSARGEITRHEARIALATAKPYGADVTVTDGTIGLEAPYPFRFRGRARALDLTRVPAAVPVPHVASRLDLDYDVSGRFEEPFVDARARFAPSTFLDATIGEGTVGSFDGSATPVHYTADGSIEGLDLHRLGEGLDVAWLKAPRMDGQVSGRFRLDGRGSDRTTLNLTAGGHIAHARLFAGDVHDADVSLAIADGSLRSTFDGRFDRIDAGRALDDPRLQSGLTGGARVATTVRHLLTATPTLADYRIEGSAELGPSTVRDWRIDRATIDAGLNDGAVMARRIEIASPIGMAVVSGSADLAGSRPWQVEYGLSDVALDQWEALRARHVAGTARVTGRLDGPRTALHATGRASVTRLDAPAISAATLDGNYEVVLDAARHVRTAHVAGRTSSATLAGVHLLAGEFNTELSGRDIRGHAAVRAATGPAVALDAAVSLSADRQALDVRRFDLQLPDGVWALTADTSPVHVAWNGQGIELTRAVLSAAGRRDRVGVGGTWRFDGHGRLRVTAEEVSLDAVTRRSRGPARIGGTLDADAAISGTRQAPIVTGRLVVTAGRVRRLAFDRVAARVDYRDEVLDVDARLDRAPDVWLRATGQVPAALFDGRRPARAVSLAVTSSDVPLGLVEGVTDSVRNVSGRFAVDLRVVGLSDDPHFDGSVRVAGAAFTVAATGAAYHNGRVRLALTPDRVGVEELHVEDRSGHTLDVSGSLGAHELKVGALALDVKARHFTVMRNELGTAAINADLTVRGEAATPIVAGEVTVQSGTIKVDEILRQTIFRPYATTPSAPTDGGDEGVAEEEPLDALAAINPWDRLRLQVELHVPENLRLTGQNVQVTPGPSIGLGSFDLHAGGDIWLLKARGGPLAAYGSLDRVSGTYTFQGRKFAVQSESSVDFRGGLSPELYVDVGRTISGVDTRVTIAGSLEHPELRLASTPPLDQSDILSLIVFNASAINLSSAQQQELAVRAGAIAAGFLATPLVSALEAAIGVDELTVDPGGEFGTGPKVTVGEEIVPGLVARFSRQFGTYEYDEAAIEYYLSRVLQIRATFSDAGSLNLRSPFVRIERAGIDLLLYFSF